MTYEEYKNKRQEEFNALPIVYAFNDAQFEEGMKKLGLTPDDTDKVYSLGGTGGFYLKSDSPKLKAFFESDTLSDLMKDKKFAEGAFLYELANHEYVYNYQGDYDVCSCFGSAKYGEYKDYKDYLKEMGYDDATVDAFKAARKKYYKKYGDL